MKQVSILIAQKQTINDWTEMNLLQVGAWLSLVAMKLDSRGASPYAQHKWLDEQMPVLLRPAEQWVLLLCHSPAPRSNNQPHTAVSYHPQAL